jgi:hypothetical protein
MTSSSNLPNGTTAYSSTLTAGTADLVEFPDRFGYISVFNEGTSGVLSVRADGQAATESSGVPGVDCYVVMPGESVLLANALPTWYPSSNVIQSGELEFGGGTSASSPASPGTVTPMESLAGQMTNPGTKVSIISASANAYTVAAAG